MSQSMCLWMSCSCFSQGPLKLNLECLTQRSTQNNISARKTMDQFDGGTPTAAPTPWQNSFSKALPNSSPVSALALKQIYVKNQRVQHEASPMLRQSNSKRGQREEAGQVNTIVDKFDVQRDGITDFILANTLVCQHLKHATHHT